MKTTYFINFSV